MRIENPFEQPVQNGRQIVPGTRSVRDGYKEGKADRVQALPDALDDGEPLRCGKCRRKLAPRSIRPGAVLCPRCRPDSNINVVIYRGTEAPTPPEERRRLQARADELRAAALEPRPEREITREHAIEIAAKNGALNYVAAKVEAMFEGVGKVLSEDEALALAKDVVAEFGSTAGPPGPPNYPHAYTEPTPASKHARLMMGKHPRGRRVTSSVVHDPVLLPSDGNRIERGPRPLAPLKSVDPWRPVTERIEKLRAERAAARALLELEEARAGNSDRQRQAHVLVRVQGLSRAEAGRRLGGISKQAVDKLLRKFDMSQTLREGR
jgi:hypothetical protein